MSNYPTNLTDKQWQVIKNIMAIKERKRKHSLQEIINALMYYGINGGKKVKGRKEHIIVDTLGLPMAANVHAANIHDSVGAVALIQKGC